MAALLVLIRILTPEREPADPPGGDSDPDLGNPVAESNSLPILGTLSEFRLVNQSAEPYGTDDLDGQVWIANFIFTRCTATCPAQTRELSLLQRHWQDGAGRSEVQLVSITVDPDHDTPEILQAYATQNDADPELWSFLTGATDDIRRLSREQFFLAVEDAPSEAASPITHSSKFVLIDPYRRIRGFYDGLSAEERDQLVRDVGRVREERKAVPQEALAPPWLETRRDVQLATADTISAFHDFQFYDRRPESGITFQNKIVDDAGRDYLASHYDHGNGVASARRRWGRALRSLLHDAGRPQRVMAQHR